MNRMMTWSVYTFAAVMILAVVGCGMPSLPDEGATAEGQPDGTSGSQLLKLDHGPKAPVAGYKRFDGDCRTFPYSLQYPGGWEMRASRGISISKTRTDDTQFGMETRENHGSVHAANLEKMALAQGLTEVGHVEVGGQQVKVLNQGDRYFLQTPHGNAALFHHLEVLSTLGVEETLRILNTLEPLEEC